VARRALTLAALAPSAGDAGSSSSGSSSGSGSGSGGSGGGGGSAPPSPGLSSALPPAALAEALERRTERQGAATDALRDARKSGGGCRCHLPKEGEQRAALGKLGLKALRERAGARGVALPPECSKAEAVERLVAKARSVVLCGVGIISCMQGLPSDKAPLTIRGAVKGVVGLLGGSKQLLPLA
jgi:hypothetical protein